MSDQLKCTRSRFRSDLKNPNLHRATDYKIYQSIHLNSIDFELYFRILTKSKICAGRPFIHMVCQSSSYSDSKFNLES